MTKTWPRARKHLRRHAADAPSAMTNRSRGDNGRWLGFLLAALTAVFISLLGAATASAAEVPATQARPATHTPEAQVVVGPDAVGVGASQRLGTSHPTYDFASASGVVAENPVVATRRLAPEYTYDGAAPIYDALVLFVDARTVVHGEGFGRRANAVSFRRQSGAVTHRSVAVSRFVFAAKAGGAYGTALSGGRHAGFLANYAGKPTAQIERGINSIEKQVAAHQAKIANPGRYIDEWASLDPRQQQALVNSKWPGDIARQQEQLDILRGILGSR